MAMNREIGRNNTEHAYNPQNGHGRAEDRRFERGDDNEPEEERGWFGREQSLYQRNDESSRRGIQQEGARPGRDRDRQYGRELGGRGPARETRGDRQYGYSGGQSGAQSGSGQVVGGAARTPYGGGGERGNEYTRGHGEGGYHNSQMTGNSYGQRDRGGSFGSMQGMGGYRGQHEQGMQGGNYRGDERGTRRGSNQGMPYDDSMRGMQRYGQHDEDMHDDDMHGGGYGRGMQHDMHGDRGMSQRSGGGYDPRGMHDDMHGHDGGDRQRMRNSGYGPQQQGRGMRGMQGRDMHDQRGMSSYGQHGPRGMQHHDEHDDMGGMREMQRDHFSDEQQYAQGPYGRNHPGQQYGGPYDGALWQGGQHGGPQGGHQYGGEQYGSYQHRQDNDPGERSGDRQRMMRDSGNDLYRRDRDRDRGDYGRGSRDDDRHRDDYRGGSSRRR